MPQGIFIRTREHGLAISKAKKGHITTEETRKKISIAKTQDINIRFWEKVEKTETCWIWKGSSRNGYGIFRYKGRNIYAHRFVWFLTYDKFPTLHICHHCDNPPCVRPDHLFEGTDKDNLHDAMRKGRFHPGHAPDGTSYNRSLTFEQAQEIRKKYIKGVYGFLKLAKEYNVDSKTIQNIILKPTKYYFK